MTLFGARLLGHPVTLVQLLIVAKANIKCFRVANIQ